MARIRSIKPEIWTNEQFVECSTMARLLYLGMQNFCDDAGNIPASVKTLKMQVFPGDDCTAAQVSGFVEELITNGLVDEYQAGGTTYWHVMSWDSMQKVDRPNIIYPQYSTNVRRAFDERSSSDRRAITPGEERKGEERKGREGELPARAHEGDEFSEKNENSDPFEKVYNAILAYLRPDDWAPLKALCDRAKYDPSKHGEAGAEVRAFCSYYLGKPDTAPALEANPVNFFTRRFVGWLEKAINWNRKGSGTGKTTKKPWTITLETAKEAAKSAHGATFSLLSDRDYGWPLQAATEAEFRERLADKIKQKLQNATAQATQRNGEVSLGAVIANLNNTIPTA